MVSLRAGLAIGGATGQSGSGVRARGVRRILFAVLGLMALRTPAQSADEALQTWLGSQTQLNSWTADFTQTRHLAALTQPLSAPGRVWFEAPDRFRWELGQPARSVALRDGEDLLVLSPALKRAERYSLGGTARGPVKDALALLDTGFPRDAATFRARFDVLGLTATNATWIFRLRPRLAATRQLLPALSLEIRTNDMALVATELRFTDGSRLRNDFTNAVRNPSIAADRFSTALDASWTLSNPTASP